MKKLKIALIQIAGNENNLKANLQKGKTACCKAKKLGADIALFPEMWSINYSCSPRKEKARKEGETKGDNLHKYMGQAFSKPGQRIEHGHHHYFSGKTRSGLI